MLAVAMLALMQPAAPVPEDPRFACAPKLVLTRGGPPPPVFHAERIGPRDANRAYRRSKAAVEALKRIVDREGIRCGLKDKATLYLAGDEYGSRALDAEAEARAALG